MLRFLLTLGSFLAGVLGGRAAADAPRLAVECEHAQRARGAARLCPDSEASRVQCLELGGEDARALLPVRVRRKGTYVAWARARLAGGKEATLAVAAEGIEPLTAKVTAAQWAWVKLGPVTPEQGTCLFALSAKGAPLRVDQLLLAGDPAHKPEQAADTSRSVRYVLQDIYFADDFMRTQREPGPWELVAGDWKIRELTIRERFDATRSANAFSFLGVGEGGQPALALTGYPHWRNYTIEAAARSIGGQPFGLVILHQDAKNYYLLHFDLPRHRIELRRVLDGQESRLAACPGALRPDQWYRVRLAACDGLLVASVDGRELFRVQDYAHLAGRPGIWSADPKGAYYDDVLVRSWRAVWDPFQGEGLDGWEMAEGQWKAAKGTLEGQGVLLGRGTLGDFQAEATVHPGAAEAGLLFDWRDAKHHARLALLPKDGKAEIRQVADGKATVLASAKLPGDGKQPLHVVLSQRGGRVRTVVNGQASVGAFRPDAGEGRVGLFATGKAARFGPVQLAQAQRPEPDVTHNRIFAGEDTMAAWASAGSDWQLAEGDPRTVAWHEMQHWGDCSLRYTLAEAGQLAGKLGLALRADGQKVDSGVQLVVEPKDGSPATFSLLLGGKAVGTAKAPSAEVRVIELRWLARSAAAFVDGKLLLCHRVAKPPAGRRMALWTEGWTPSLANVRVESAHVWNDHFETAPWAWRAETGEWEMQNRWTCSPQWSWLGGGGPDTATLWTKRPFRGDVQVHYFGAFQMKQVGSRIYRPHNLNVTLCGDGRNPFSGYTFLCGGWNNTATALLRHGKVVASTTKTAVRPPTLLDTTPSTNYLHRKWWHIAIEKQGSRVRCWMDGELACEFTDPEPLEGGQVCIWTFNNSIMVARAWIAYEEGGALEEPLLPPPASAEPKAAPPQVACSHPLVYEGFESGLGEWQGTEGHIAVSLEPRGEGLALAVRNVHAGGPFSLVLPLAPLDAMTHARLAFDYRIPADAKVNLHATVDGKLYSIALTAPEARPVGATRLGAVALQADDQWHHADIPLRALLLRALPEAEKLPVSRLAIAAPPTAHDYLRAGLGGNRAGATYRLDNVRLWAPGPPEVTFSWEKTLIAHCVVNQKPDTVPAKPPEGPGTFQAKGLKDGLWYFHIKAKPQKGEWGPVAHIPFRVDSAPPQLAASEPKAGAKSPAHVVTVQLADPSGVLPKSLATVTLNGKACPVRVQGPVPAPTTPEKPATFDPVSGTLTLDLAQLPLNLKDGEAVELAVPAVADLLGHKAGEQKVAWTFDRANDKQPPTHLRLTGSHPPLCQDDFESGLGEWQAVSSDGTVYSIIQRDPTTAASGRCSLRIHNPRAGGPFTVVVRSSAFDAGRYPLVAFDYKVPSNVRVDLRLSVDGESYTIRFTDPGGSNCIGAIPDVQTDNQWHHTEFNLHEILTAALPKASSYTVDHLRLGDTGHDGNADGVEYHIDNFTIAPAASTRTSPLEWALEATDPSGIAVVQYCLAPLPASVKWKDAKEPKWSFQKLGAGLFQFLVRARDGAGNWSEPLERKVLIDDEPPAVEAVSPADGSSAADGRVQVKLADAPSGIHREKTRLTIAGKTYTAAQEGVTYNARAHTLTWAGLELDEPVVFANGQPVACQLEAEDNVGNAATHTWTWKMDYALDKTPPPPPYVARVPSKPLLRDTFEKDDGQWKGYGKYGSVSRTAVTAATGRRALRIRATRSNSYFGAYARRGSDNAAAYPLVSFDYRMPPGMPINLHVHTGGSWKTIRLTSRTSNYTVVGHVPLQADNEWHHADINLLKFLKPTETSKGKSRLLVRYLLFSDFATRSISAGTRFYIDNFTIAAPETGQSLDFEWTAVADPTGVAGYAVALDTKPDTVPTDLKPPDETRASFQDLHGGTWTLHLRARDGAGNWSPVVHFPTRVEGPPPPKPKPKEKPKEKAKPPPKDKPEPKEKPKEEPKQKEKPEPKQKPKAKEKAAKPPEKEPPKPEAKEKPKEKAKPPQKPEPKEKPEPKQKPKAEPEPKKDAPKPPEKEAPKPEPKEKPEPKAPPKEEAKPKAEPKKEAPKPAEKEKPQPKEKAPKPPEKEAPKPEPKEKPEAKAPPKEKDEAKAEPKAEAPAKK